MSHSIAPVLVFALAFAGTTDVAAQYDPHVSHHPVVVAPATVPSSDAARAIGRMHAQVAAMTEMHEKMMAAKKPKEREALMAENMRLIQASIDMMREMSPDWQSSMKCDTSVQDQVMEERMKMMQTVMQMMIDRLPPRSVD